MTRTILFLAIAVILFSVAAGGSWYLQYQQTKDSELTKNTDEKTSKTSGAASKKSGTEPSPSRPLVRPPTAQESQRMSQLVATLQQQQESLKNREQLVVTREKQMNILHDEVKKEHKKLETVRKEIHAELVLLQEKLDQLEKRA